MAICWAVVNEQGAIWFTNIGTEAYRDFSSQITYSQALNRAAVFDTQEAAEEWAARNVFRKPGEVYKVAKVEIKAA